MTSPQRVQEYLEKHKIGTLFEVKPVFITPKPCIIGQIFVSDEIKC